MLGDVNKLLVFKSLLTMTMSKILIQLKKGFGPIVFRGNALFFLLLLGSFGILCDDVDLVGRNPGKSDSAYLVAKICNKYKVH